MMKIDSAGLLATKLVLIIITKNSKQRLGFITASIVQLDHGTAITICMQLTSVVL